MFTSLIAARTFGLTLKGMSMTETGRGYAWSAKIHLNGKKVGTVENRGDGGCNFVHAEIGVCQKLVEGAKAGGYIQTEADGETPAVFENDEVYLEEFLTDLFDSMDMLKRVKRNIKTKTYFTKKGAEPGSVSVINMPFSPSLKARLLERQDIGFILNDLLD